MATLQVRSIDDRLYQALRARALMENRSISQEVVSIIKEHLSRPNNDNQNATMRFIELCGTWKDDRSAKEIADEIRKSRTNSTYRFIEAL